MGKVMTNRTPTYLHTCLAAFRDVSQQKYGTPFDLLAIEQAVNHLRTRTPLTYADLQYFTSRQHWWFEKFWVFPPEHHLTPALKRRKFNFWQLPREEKPIIASLLDAFKSIELASIILRFIRPEHYGIISPPVERILDVRRGSDAVETYLNYLEDLRAIRQHYGFRRAAEADMALWVLHERCFGTLRDGAIERAYAKDPLMLRIRTKNLTAHLLSGYSYAQLAHSLLPVHLELAAQLAGIAFERMVRQRAPKGSPDSSEDLDLKTLIDQLYEGGTLDSLTRGRWQAARRIRNKAIHGTATPTLHEVQRLLAELGRDED